MKNDFDYALIIFPCVMGMFLGLFFFGGLWWTIRKGLKSHVPSIWFAVSLIVRISCALLVFYYVANGHWQRFLACLLGFIFIRYIFVRRVAKGNLNGIKP